MEYYKDVGDLLQQFIDDIGVSACIVTDGATEFVGRNTDFIGEARNMRMNLSYSGQCQYKQNYHAEQEIDMLYS
eukprot:6340557-Ditylum_brightwellii.AAC.1